MSFCGNLQIADSRKSVWLNALVSYDFASLPLEIDRFLVSNTFWGSAIRPFSRFLVISHAGFICAGITPKQDKPLSFSLPISLSFSLSLSLSRFSFPLSPFLVLFLLVYISLRWCDGTCIHAGELVQNASESGVCYTGGDGTCVHAGELVHNASESGVCYTGLFTILGDTDAS